MKVQCLDHFRRHADDPRTTAIGSRDPTKNDATEICGMAMPMPTPEHLYCVEKWSIRPGIVCDEVRARTSADGSGGGGLVFGEEAGLAWEVSF